MASKKNTNNNDDQKVVVESKKINWHSGFADAMILEIRNVSGEFRTTPEFHYESKQHKIDLFIEKVGESSNESLTGLGKYFRRYTLCEFKSPRKTLTINGFSRLVSLGMQICAEDPNKKLKDIAAMFVLSHKPRGMFNKLPKEWVVEKSEPGIYIVRGIGIFTSVVVISELSEDLYKWLPIVRNNLSIKKLKTLIKEYELNQDDIVLGKLLDIILDINLDKIESKIINKGARKMQRRLITVLEQTPYGIKYFAKRDKVAIARGKTEGIAEGINKGIIRVLTRRFDTMPKKLQRQIMEVKDIDKLDELIGIAATCVSIDEFADAFN
ncbi:MAG: hypothetical protein LBB88_09905 [Planctomycetaceae bacterium]|jgi:hypothetical protein|nr:hypothetical protein [Planctomycetaceae bacterium]